MTHAAHLAEAVLQGDDQLICRVLLAAYPSGVMPAEYGRVAQIVRALVE